MAQYYLKDCVTRLKALVKTVKDTTDIEPLKAKFYTIAYDMAMSAEEGYFTFEDYFYRELKIKITNAIKTIDATNDPSDYRDIISSIINTVGDDRDYVSPQISKFRGTKYSAVTSYRPLENVNIQGLSSMITLCHRTVNMLDPRCRDGINLCSMKTLLNKNDMHIMAYGIESDSLMSDAAKTRIDRVAKGGLSGSKISNEVFDMMFLEPTISWQLTQLGTLDKQEKKALQDTIKYLRMGGSIVIVIPYFKMYKDMCLHIAKNYKGVQVRKLIGRDFYDKGLIAITGIRVPLHEPDEKIYRLLRGIHNIDDIKTIDTNPFDKITFPPTQEEIEFFRGSVLDMDEMQQLVNSSGCYDAFWNGQAVEKLNENIKQPLLPFNIGQIGLVLTSGCLDGIVDEGDGHFHVIKGRVSKQTTQERNVIDRDNIEVNETISNRVEINVIMPNGEYKVLA
jgi:hypothetical protein